MLREGSRGRKGLRAEDGGTLERSLVGVTCNTRTCDVTTALQHDPTRFSGGDMHRLGAINYLGRYIREFSDCGALSKAVSINGRDIKAPTTANI